MNAAMGKICFVNCSTHEITEEILEPSFYESYLSGVGLGVAILRREKIAQVNPFSKDNMLGFVSGLLTGSGSVVTGRWMAVCKSPITGGWGDANCGGTLSLRIKQCGYDGIFFTGEFEKPSIFVCDETGPRIEDASLYWGLDAIESEEKLIEVFSTKKRCVVATIGQAGENGSLIATISNDRGRMAARSGVGFVMGQKKLKAVVLRGNEKVQVADRKKMGELSGEYSKKVRKLSLPHVVKGSMLPMFGKIMSKSKKAHVMDGILSAPIMKKYGTNFANTALMFAGDNPVKNWSGSARDISKEYMKQANPDRLLRKEVKKYHCSSCVIGCGAIIKTERLQESHKPEYETINSFGALLLNHDIDLIDDLNDLCNRAGIDTIAAGSTIAFAMECYQNQLMEESFWEGIECTWGNTEAITVLLNKMIRKEGIGNIFGDGVGVATRHIPNSQKFAMIAGNVEPGMHDPRFDPQLGVHFSADPTPGRHTIGSSQYYNYMRLWEQVSWAPKVKSGTPLSNEYQVSEENALKSMASTCIKSVVDGSGGCLFAMIMGLDHWPLFQWLNAATGWEKTADEYMIIGHRIALARQQFNVEAGIQPKSFLMNPRLYGAPAQSEGPNRGKSYDLNGMVEKHFEALGCSIDGIPLESTLNTLNL